MVLLPLDEYNKYRSQMYALQTTPVVNPLQKELSSMTEVYGTNIPDDQLTKLQGEIIQKYADKSEFTKPEQQDSKDEDDSWIKETIGGFNRTNRNKSLQIIKILELRSKKGWNAKGELYNDDGTIIKGSNILDLIDYVTTIKRQKTVAPKGFGKFREILIDANIPLHLFSKIGLEQINNYSEHVEKSPVSKTKKHSFDDWIS